MCVCLDVWLFLNDAKEYFAEEAGARFLERITVLLMSKNFVVYPLLCFSSAYIDEYVLWLYAFAFNAKPRKQNIATKAISRLRNEPELRLFSYQSYLEWVKISDIFENEFEGEYIISILILFSKHFDFMLQIWGMRVNFMLIELCCTVFDHVFGGQKLSLTSQIFTVWFSVICSRLLEV